MKHTTVLARILCMALMLCMLVATFAACANDDDAAVATTQGSNNQATGQPTDEDGFLLDNIPDNLKLDREMTILYSDYLKASCAPDNLSEDVVQNATFNRNQMVEDRLNIDIKWVPEPGKWDDSKNTFIAKLEQSIKDGKAYDAVLSYNLFPGAFASKGLVQNIADTKYVDFTMPWWPKAYTDDLLVNNTIYGIAENSTKSNIQHLHGVFFNEDLIEDYKLDDPYQMVADNTWTFANMMAMIKDTYSDKDTKAGKSDGDFFGLVTGTQAKIETWFFSMGYRYSQKTESGEIELLINDQSYMSEWIDTFNAAADSNDFLMYDTKGHTEAFFDNRAVLYATSIVMIDSMQSRQIEMNYGVVPFPKKDSNQKEYYSNVANHHATWTIPNSVKSVDESSALLECMSSQAYRQIAPVYFDQCIKLRYSPTEKLGPMYELIRDSICFDFLQVYSFALPKDPRTLITYATWNGQAWQDVWGTHGGQLEDGFADILALYGLS